MTSFKALAVAVLLSATVATPVLARAPADTGALYLKNLRDSGYNPKNDFNPNGTMRAAIQEPGLFAFYYRRVQPIAATHSANFSAGV
jgi:hypothetical protein